MESTEVYNSNTAILKIEPAEKDYGGKLSIRKTLNLITIEGAFANVFIVYSGGAFLTGLILMLGANEFQIGLVAAIPFISQIAQLFSSFYVDQPRKRKSIIVRGLVIGRQSWWFLIPLLFIGGDWRLDFLIPVILFSNLMTMFVAPGWLSWMSEIVPARIRGRYFGKRNIAIAVSTIIATVAGGKILDIFRASNREHLGFTIILASGCLFALTAAFLLHRIPETGSRQGGPEHNPSILLEPFKDSNFRRLLKVFFIWNIAIGTAAPFFAPYMLINLKMTFTLISIYSAIGAIAAIMFNRPWGILIDKFGSRPVLVFCAFGIGAIPFIWYLPTPETLWILGFESIYSGILWAGFNLAAFTIPIANSPAEKRTSYLSILSMITGLGFFIASLSGGIILEMLSGIKFPLYQLMIINYHLIFALSGILRIASAFLFLSFHEPNEKALPLMVNFMGYSVLKRLSIGRQILHLNGFKNGK